MEPIVAGCSETRNRQRFRSRYRHNRLDCVTVRGECGRVDPLLHPIFEMGSVIPLLCGKSLQLTANRHCGLVVRAFGQDAQQLVCVAFLHVVLCRPDQP
jgi:hypothetical protein